MWHLSLCDVVVDKHSIHVYSQSSHRVMSSVIVSFPAAEHCIFNLYCFCTTKHVLVILCCLHFSLVFERQMDEAFISILQNLKNVVGSPVGLI